MIGPPVEISRLEGAWQVLCLITEWSEHRIRYGVQDELVNELSGPVWNLVGEEVRSQAFWGCGDYI